MPLILAIFTLYAPRVVVALTWLFSNFFESAMINMLFIILGFIFMPTTLLWFAAVQHWFGGQWTLIPIVGIVASVLIDISPAHTYRRREYVVAT